VGFPQKKLLAFKRIAKSLPLGTEDTDTILQAFGWWRLTTPDLWEHKRFGTASTREAFACITKEFHLLEILDEIFSPVKGAQ
jgi:hypothetical protein